ncbi:uncharacterized protein LOC144024719 [Festucalex cinctus]
MLTPEKSGAQLSTSAQMTFHRTMTTTMGPMQDSLGQSSKEREDRAHSNVRTLVLRQRKLLLIGPKVTSHSEQNKECASTNTPKKKRSESLAGLKLMNSAGSQPSSPLLQNQDQGMLQQS